MIGIDLSEPIASLPCGMRFALQRSLAGLLQSSFSKQIILLGPEKAIDAYRDLCVGPITYAHASPDEFHANGGQLTVLHSPFNTISTKLPNVTSLLTKHDLTRWRLPAYFPNQQGKDDIAECAKADHIIAVSNHAKDSIQQVTSRPNGDFSVIYNAVSNLIPAEPVEALRQVKRPLLFYPAAARPHKNHKVLFQAIQGIDCTLVLTTGEIHGSERFQELNALAREFNVATKVVVLGHVTDGQLSHIYQAADCLVFPSLAEGFGYPLVEAASYGLPVVCSYFSCIPEIMGEAATYFNPLDPMDVEKQIKDAILNNGKKRDLIEQKFDLERFSQRNIGQKLADLYDGLDETNQICRVSSDRKYRLKTKQALANIRDESSQFRFFKNKQKINILLDVSRLFDGSRHMSGIRRYIQILLANLSKTPEFRLIPFFNNRSRGVKIQAHEKALPIPPEFGSWDVLSYELALKKARCVGGSILYHSPFHPLPDNREADLCYCLTVHDIFHLTRPDLYTTGKKAITSDIVKSIQPEDEIIAVSAYSGLDLEGFLGRPLNISVCHHGLQSDFGKGRERATGKAILIALQIDPRKNFELMFSVAKQYLFRKNDGQSIILYGDKGRLSGQLKEDVEQGVANGWVELHDRPDDHVVYSLYQRASVFLYLSHCEGFGLPPLEAMQFGCFPIIGKNSSLAEVFADWPFLVDVDQPVEHLVDVIDAVQSLGRDKHREFELLMQRICRDYSVSHMVDTHVGAYCAALQRHCKV
nr:glycosyltransferase [uncultured Cohaesibacter sp.]